MKINILIKVPDSLDITDPNWIYANLEVFWELSNLLDIYTPDKAAGSEYVTGYKLVHAVVETSITDPVNYIEGLIAIYELDWEVLGCQSFYNEIDEVWDYTDPENPVLVSPAEPIVYKPVDTINVFPFLQTRWNRDGDGNPTTEIPKEINWLHKFNGMVDWQ